MKDNEGRLSGSAALAWPGAARLNQSINADIVLNGVIDNMGDPNWVFGYVRGARFCSRPVSVFHRPP